MSDFDDVGEFHRKFGLEVTGGQPPHEATTEVRAFRLRFLLEELTELADAYGYELVASFRPKLTRAVDLPGAADALVDLVYVALGTAHLHGLPWPELFAEVQRANMTKERAQRPSDSKRGSTRDVVKPPGWEPPAIARVLADYGWSCDGNHSAPPCDDAEDCWRNLWKAIEPPPEL